MNELAKKIVFTAGITVCLSALLLSFCATENPTAMGSHSAELSLADTVSAAAHVSITNPGEGSLIFLGDTVRIGAMVFVDTNGSSGNSWIGTVSFYRNNVLIGKSSASPYTCSWKAAVAGSFILKAVATSSTGTVDTSMSVSVTVRDAFIAISEPWNNAQYAVGDSISFVAAALNPARHAVKRVDFFSNGVRLFSDYAGPFSSTIYNAAEGSYILKVKAYDTKGKIDSATTTVTVRHFPPTVYIYQPADSDVVFRGDTVTIAAGAWATDSQSHISKVVFFSNGKRLGVDATAPYEFPWSDTAIGVFTLKAKAFTDKGDTATSPSVTVTRQDGFITLSGPFDNQRYQVGDSVILLARAGAVRFHTIKDVKFYRNNKLIATITAAPYRFVWRNAAAGIYTIKAIATDTKGQVNISNSATISVKNDPPIVYISEPANNTVVRAGSTVPVSARAYSTDSSGTISYVKFYRNGALLATDYSAPYTYSWANASIGNYVLTATACNSRGTLGFSDSVKVAVVSKVPTIAITAPAVGDTFGPTTPVVVKASITDFDKVAYVKFIVDSQSVAAIDSVAPYTASLNGLAPGYYLLSAVAVVATGVEYASNSVYFFINDFPRPAVSITSPKDSSSFLSTQSIAIQATAGSTTGPIKRVVFWSDSLLIATDSISPYSCTWVKPPKGVYTLSASATDSNGATGTSNGVRVTVR